LKKKGTALNAQDLVVPKNPEKCDKTQEKKYVIEKKCSYGARL